MGRGREIEIVAGGVILLIAAAGTLMWAKWGLLVVLEVVVQSCF